MRHGKIYTVHSGKELVCTLKFCSPFYNCATSPIFRGNDHIDVPDRPEKTAIKNIENKISNWSSKKISATFWFFSNRKLKILCKKNCKGFSISHYKKKPKKSRIFFSMANSKFCFEYLFTIFFLELVWGTNIWNINFGDQRTIISYYL